MLRSLAVSSGPGLGIRRWAWPAVGGTSWLLCQPHRGEYTGLVYPLSIPRFQASNHPSYTPRLKLALSRYNPGLTIVVVYGTVSMLRVGEATEQGGDSDEVE